MSEQYLILHKVRGEPSFDCATKISCPSCEAARQGLDHGNDYAGNCGQCDDGHWWITNSGHRAYPYWELRLDALYLGGEVAMTPNVADMPPDWPDHFQVQGEKPPSNFNIMSAIQGLMPKLKRRV